MEQIRDVLSASDTPLTSTQIAQKIFKSPKPADIDKVEAVLRELAKSKNFFEHPPRKKGDKKRYWKESPTAVTKSIIQRILGTKEKPTLTAVKKAIPASYKSLFDEAIGSLIKEKKVYALVVGRVKYLLNRPPRATEFLLGRHLTALKEIVERVNLHRRTKVTFDELMNFLDGEIKDSPDISKEIPDALMYEWYKEDLSKLFGSKSVPIPWTWSRYQKWCDERRVDSDLTRFHDRLRQLALDGKIELIPHGRTQPIPPEHMSIAFENHRGELIYFWKWL